MASAIPASFGDAAVDVAAFVRFNALAGLRAGPGFAADTAVFLTIGLFAADFLVCGATVVASSAAAFAGAFLAFIPGTAVALDAVAFCARKAAQRFREAAAIRFLPAALIRRFGRLAVSTEGAAALLAFRAAAHRLRCAAAIRARAAALSTRFVGAP